jgi:hypothetical protein
MNFSEENVPAELIAAAKRSDVVPLIGAGFSKQADASVPNWTQLLELLYDYAAAQDHITATERTEISRLVEDGRFLMAAQELRERIPDAEFFALMDEAFADIDVGGSSVHRLLWDLKPSLVMTTNYDKLIENSYAKEFGEVPRLFMYDEGDGLQRQIQAGRLNMQPPMIFKLHGTIDRPDETILTEREYRVLLYRQPGYRLVLSGIFLTKVVLMLGFSGDDPELMRLLEQTRESLKYQGSPDFAFMPLVSGSVAARRLRDDFGIRVISYSPSDPSHPELAEFLEFLVAERKAA